MGVVSKSAKNFVVKAYTGDNKTLLAFNFLDPSLGKDLAGFSIACKLPGNEPAFYLFNLLGFQNPGSHAQVKSEPPHSTANAPVQKYRWVDFAHAASGGGALVAGDYTYTVTPRYFDAKGSMLAMDASKSVSVTVPVGPFASKALRVGFTRGYMQSQAYARHFGAKTPLQPANRPLQYATSSQAGTNNGQPVTYEQIYEWMGETARATAFSVLQEVLNDKTLHLDVFAYDLNEPDMVTGFLALAGQGRIRIILDSAQLHITHTQNNKQVVPLEDDFAAAFAKAASDKTALKRGCFARYSHDKIFIVSKNGAAQKVLTGSTNWSVTGLYVNANHVLVFDEPTVAQFYAKVFQESWSILTSAKPSQSIANAFAATPLAHLGFSSTAPTLPKMIIHASPHTAADTQTILGGIQKRIQSEASTAKGNVLFAVMQLTNSPSPVYSTLSSVHGTTTLYSYGISDSPGGIKLYAPGSKTGVLVTGKPSHVILPPPFDQVPSPTGHEIHDKFVVCGINGSDPVVWCGSSNLATGGEESNGDNLLEIHDADVATAFGIEALLLVDHYNFLDRYASSSSAKSNAGKVGTTSASKAAGANGAAKTTPAKSTSQKKTAASKAAAGKTSAKKPVAKKKVSAKKARKPVVTKSMRSRPSTIRTASVRRSGTVARMMAPAKKALAKAKANGSAAKVNSTKGAQSGPQVAQMPQSLDQAAKQAAMYLYTNDAWSLHYFDPNDLHYIERELFG